jgi:tetratricopeptide (TPR) repeat protein
VHEVVEPSLAELGIPVRPAGIPVHHYGKLNEADDRRKGEAYFELGLRKVEALGEDVVAISELAIQARALGRYDEAVELWKRVLSIRADLPIAWFNMGSALIELGRHDEARTACARAAALDSGHREIAYNAALVELYAGEARASLAALEGVVKRWPDYPAAQALRVAALWCAGRAGDAAAPLAALRRDGFDVAGYVAVVAGHLTGAGRDDLARTILDSAREAGLAAAAAHPVPAARP